MPTAKKGTFPYYMRSISTWRLDEVARPGAVYFVLAAVRGSDNSHYLLSRIKAMVTARVRAIVFKKGVTRGEYLAVPFNQDTLGALKSAVADLVQLRQEDKSVVGSGHYMGHLYEALKATSRHPIWGGHGAAIREQLAKVS